MKYIYITLFISFTFLSTSNSQELIGGGVGRTTGLISTMPVVINDKVEGSPYVAEKFTSAKFLLQKTLFSM